MNTVKAGRASSGVGGTLVSLSNDVLLKETIYNQ